MKRKMKHPFDPVTSGLSPGRYGSAGICEADWLTQSLIRGNQRIDVGSGTGSSCGAGTILNTYTDTVVVGSGSGMRHSAGNHLGCGGSSFNPEPDRLRETL
jgi:hypothetical protein